MYPRTVLLAAAALLLFTRLAEAQNFNQLVAVGDSTTDTGWFAHASGSPGQPLRIRLSKIKSALGFLLILPQMTPLRPMTRRAR
jgi:hypothetical protein